MQYQAPAKDLSFLLFDVLGVDKLHELAKYADATPDLITAVIEEAGKLASEVIQPTNQVGDRQGCQYNGSAAPRRAYRCREGAGIRHTVDCAECPE